MQYSVDKYDTKIQCKNALQKYNKIKYNNNTMHKYNTRMQ